MEPLEPEFREALKQAHPGLSDAQIDRVEQLLVQRMNCNPQTEPEKIAELDRQRAAMIEREIPRYAEVAQSFRARQEAAQKGPKDPKFTITSKRPRG